MAVRIEEVDRLEQAVVRGPEHFDAACRDALAGREQFLERPDLEGDVRRMQRLGRILDTTR